MTAARGFGTFGHTRTRREARDVPEARVERDDLAKVIGVRKQRLARLERECMDARLAWREARKEIGVSRQRWRDALLEAQEFWQQARAGFLSMTTTSGQFRKAKAVYERMKEDAARLHLACGDAVKAAKDKRALFFAARRRVGEAMLQQEKLVMLRDEIRSAQMQEEW
ncbi:MAG TPA: hypothetical protein VEC35_22490 [Noviherbaspirillum sp.]|nr:hypothetical protein [Noviherbaspirillum sp.]